MYRIYARKYGTIDWILIHALNLANNNIIVYNPKITQELNRASTLTFVAPDVHPYYPEIKPLITEIKVYSDNERIFWGRVLDTQRDFYRQKTVTCESELAFLNDVILRPYDYQANVSGYFAQLINSYNSIASYERRFIVGQCTVVDANDNIVRSNHTYPNVWDELKKKLLDNLGGYLIPVVETQGGSERTRLDYVATPSAELGQEIRFGKNLIDLDDFLDGAGAYDRIVPLGNVVDQETSDRLTIVNVNDGKDYLANAEYISTYGVIERAVQWDDVTIDTNLKTKGAAELARNLQFVQTIQISAVDLHLLDVNTDALRVGYRYKIVSVPHGINTFYLLSKATINLDAPDKSVYTFGATKKTLTGG